MGKNVRKKKDVRRTSGFLNAAAPSLSSVAAPAAPANLLMSTPQSMLVNTLLPNYIWVIQNFMSPKECEAWIDWVECSRELEYINQRATRYMASRECFRVQMNNPVMAEQLFRRIQAVKSLLTEELMPKNGPTENSSFTPVGCNPNLRVYKYSSGHAFSKHIDETNIVPGLGETKFTVLVYLSDCHGGATRFFPPQSSKKEGGNNSIAFAPKMGAMLIHLHGEDCLLHQADPVEKGIKYVLRTDLVYSMK